MNRGQIATGTVIGWGVAALFGLYGIISTGGFQTNAQVTELRDRQAKQESRVAVVETKLDTLQKTADETKGDIKDLKKAFNVK